MKKKIESVLDAWKNRHRDLPRHQSLIGFDGFIDQIAKPVREKVGNGRHRYFRELSELGQYILSKQGRNCCIEMDEKMVKTGGSAQIFATAVGRLGVTIDCVGAMGFPEIHPVFEQMKDDRCTLHSYAAPGHNIALEFDSGKFMMANMNELGSIKWEQIKSRIGLDRLIRMFRESSLIGMINWSEIFHANTIWQGILDDIAPIVGPDRSKLVYFDLSDCSSRSREHIQEAMTMLKNYSRLYRVAFGMNENEAHVISQALIGDDAGFDLMAMGTRLYAILGVDDLLIHRKTGSVGWNEGGSFDVPNYYTDSPVLSTGAGDNFNAGYCVAKLLGMNMESCMILAHAVAGFYVRNGASPTPDGLSCFLQEWRDTFVGRGGES